MKLLLAIVLFISGACYSQNAIRKEYKGPVGNPAKGVTLCIQGVFSCKEGVIWQPMTEWLECRRKYCLWYKKTFGFYPRRIDPRWIEDGHKKITND